MNEQTPEEKALAAAEALAAGGTSVTARAVREASGVRMAVATEAARSWNDAAAAQGAVPEVPEAVRRRFDAVWTEAYGAARAEFDEARAGWEARVSRLETESAELVKAVEEAEQEAERVSAAAAANAESAAAALARAGEVASKEAREASHLLAAATSRADKAEGRLEAITAERDRLLVEVAALREAH